jgi:UDP-glucose 4-epimerase
VDKVGVKRIAEIVCEEMGLEGLEFRFTGGVDGGRGWRGDVKAMLLSVDKLVSLGWRPKLDSEGAVRLSCRELLESVKVDD